MAGVGAGLLQAAWANGSKWLGAYETGASLRQKQQQIDLQSQAQSFQSVMSLLQQQTQFQQQQYQNQQGAYQFERKQGFDEAQLAQRQNQFDATMSERERANQSLIDLRAAQEKKYGSQYDPSVGAAIAGQDIPAPLTLAANGAPPDVNDKSIPAAIRYNNPGAQWPHAQSSQYGMSGYGVIGGNNQIAQFPTPQQGAASNMDLLSRNYVGMTIGDAAKKWSGGGYSSIAGFDPDTVITPDLVKDPAFAIPFFKSMSKVEAGKPYPMSDDQWQQAHDLFMAGGVNAQTQTTGAGGAPAQLPVQDLRSALAAFVSASNAGDKDKADQAMMQISQLQGSTPGAVPQAQAPAARQLGQDEMAALTQTKTNLAQRLAKLRSMPQTPEVQQQMQTLNNQFGQILQVQQQQAAGPTPTAPQQLSPDTTGAGPSVIPSPIPVLPAANAAVTDKLRKLDELKAWQKSPQAKLPQYANAMVRGSMAIAELSRDPDVQKAQQSPIPPGATEYEATIIDPVTRSSHKVFYPSEFAKRQALEHQSKPLSEPERQQGLLKANKEIAAATQAATNAVDGDAQTNARQRLNDALDAAAYYRNPQGRPASPTGTVSPVVTPAVRNDLGSRLSNALKALQGK